MVLFYNFPQVVDEMWKTEWIYPQEKCEKMLKKVIHIITWESVDCVHKIW